jgi:hypothetical protein
MGEQAVLVSRKAEEIALLLNPFDRRSRGRAPASVRLLRQLALVEIGLVPNRVPAGILGEIDVSPLRIRRQSSWVEGRWSESVVRMNRS